MFPCPRPIPASDAPDECRNCAHAVEQAVDNAGRPYVRHTGEHRRRMRPLPEDAAALARARVIVRAALADLPEGATDAERSDAAVEALLRDGRLRRNRGPRRYVEDDPVPSGLAPRYEVA